MCVCVCVCVYQLSKYVMQEEIYRGRLFSRSRSDSWLIPSRNWRSSPETSLKRYVPQPPF